MKTQLRYGLIGCGGFGRFCLRQYESLAVLQRVAVADASLALARSTAEEFGLDCMGSAEELIARPDIDIIHLATPPGTHYQLACAALEAGKHVLCEKPLALTAEDASRMVELAKSKHLVLAVNLIMRYNPLNTAIHDINRSGVLGKPIFASLINLAQDETLPPSHWFWDRSESGAIFIEHGVHFFDLFEWWFGHGRVLSAQQVVRPGTTLVDQVQCTIRYGELTLGSFYHGFHQMLRQDRQDWEIVFELGVIRCGARPADRAAARLRSPDRRRVFGRPMQGVQPPPTADRRRACGRDLRALGYQGRSVWKHAARLVVRSNQGNPNGESPADRHRIEWSFLSQLCSGGPKPRRSFLCVRLD